MSQCQARHAENARTYLRLSVYRAPLLLGTTVASSHNLHRVQNTMSVRQIRQEIGASVSVEGQFSPSQDLELEPTITTLNMGPSAVLVPPARQSFACYPKVNAERAADAAPLQHAISLSVPSRGNREQHLNN